jgi:hypothetical protein
MGMGMGMERSSALAAVSCWRAAAVCWARAGTAHDWARRSLSVCLSAHEARSARRAAAARRLLERGRRVAATCETHDEPWRRSDPTSAAWSPRATQGRGGELRSDGPDERRSDRSSAQRFWGGWARLPHRGSAAEAATALDGASAGSGLAGAAAGRNSRGACTSPAPALPAHPWIAASSPALTSCPLLPGLPQVPPQVPSIPTPSPSLHTQGAASPTRQPRP